MSQFASVLSRRSILPALAMVVAQLRPALAQTSPGERDELRDRLRSAVNALNSASDRLAKVTAAEVSGDDNATKRGDLRRLADRLNAAAALKGHFGASVARYVQLASAGTAPGAELRDLWQWITESEVGLSKALGRIAEAIEQMELLKGAIDASDRQKLRQMLYTKSIILRELDLLRPRHEPPRSAADLVVLRVLAEQEDELKRAIEQLSARIESLLRAV